MTEWKPYDGIFSWADDTEADRICRQVYFMHARYVQERRRNNEFENVKRLCRDIIEELCVTIEMKHGGVSDLTKEARVYLNILEHGLETVPKPAKDVKEHAEEFIHEHFKTKD